MKLVIAIIQPSRLEAVKETVQHGGGLAVLETESGVMARVLLRQTQQIEQFGDARRHDVRPRPTPARSMSPQRSCPIPSKCR